MRWIIEKTAAIAVNSSCVSGKISKKWRCTYKTGKIDDLVGILVKKNEKRIFLIITIDASCGRIIRFLRCSCAAYSSEFPKVNDPGTFAEFGPGSCDLYDLLGFDPKRPVLDQLSVQISMCPVTWLFFAAFPLVRKAQDRRLRYSHDFSKSTTLFVVQMFPNLQGNE